MRNLTVTLVAAVLVLGGFYGGFKVGQGRADASAGTSATPTPNLGAAAGLRGGAGAAGAGAAGAGAAGAGGAGAAAGAGGIAGAGGGAGGRGGNAVQGTVTAVGSGTITVHDRTSNTDVTINIGSASITRTEAGQPADLQKDVTVAVQGQKGADGTVQATAVTIVSGSAAPAR